MLVQQDFDINQIEMVSDNILIKKDSRFEHPKKVGNIYIPQAANMSLMESKIGTVKAVGKGRKTIKTGELILHGIKKGDVVYYARYGTEKFIWEDGQFVVAHEQAVLAFMNLENSTKPTPDNIVCRTDRILVKPLDNDIETTTSGIVIHKGKAWDRGKLVRYKVIKTGPGRVSFKTGYTFPMTVTPDEIIYAASINGAQISFFNGENFDNYRLLSLSDCILHGTIRI
jgi:co-chaperonin GroES (HSP10)